MFFERTSIPEWPPYKPCYFNKEEVARYSFAFDIKKRHHKQEFALEDWVNLNRYTHISIEEWMKLDSLTRCSLVDIVNARVQSENAKQRDHDEGQQKQLMLEANKVKLPFDQPSSTNRILNM